MEDELLLQWIARHQAGESWAKIGAEHGLSFDAVRNRIRRLLKSTKVKQNGPGAQSTETGIIFTDVRAREDEEKFAEKYLDLIIEQQALEKTRDNEQDVAHVQIRESKPFAIVFSGDWHLGNRYTDHVSLRNHLEFVSQTPGMYIQGMGDYCDYFIGRLSRVAVTEQQYKPAQQRILARDLLVRKTGGKLVSLLAGNHCWKPEELTGEDPVAEVAAEIKTPYLGFGGTLYISTGDIEYKGACWHSYPGGSALNPGNNNRRLRNDFDSLDFNCLGHYHFNYGQSGTTREGRDFVDMRSGSFKVRDARYAAAMVGTKSGDGRMPVVVFWPKIKKMWLFRDCMDKDFRAWFSWQRLIT